ncbi:DegQ family serine endoprotease [Ahrensia sp. 13_GOM-1096m]|uniref:DegQ family serine endoprotease n=1 Tax=Ahrensia sp. 13_GOM-1096m TaxID=1380380 RepID=UPI0009DFF546|nr:DegQ family serine endoprotease [Ahrensia sp. 13_GOM-1096m]
MLIRFVATTIILAAAAIGPKTAHAQSPDNSIRGFLNELFQPNEPEQNSDVAEPQAETTSIMRRVPLGQGDIQLSFAPLVEKTSPSVVNVYAARKVEQRQSPFAGDPFFEQFFGNRLGQRQPRVEASLGSGVIVDGAGLVVTNNHVIDGADEIKVALSDGREFESEVVLRDERSDLAVLRINAGEDLPALKFAESDQLLTGDLVLAIGNPFGVGQTITSGIVSAVARTRVGVSDFGFFIQTDAAINPGNSGGALIDMTGNLVGINTAIFSRSGGSNGIGFAIPANMVRAVVAQAKGGSDAFERPYIGADFEPVTPDIAESLGLQRPSGAIIASVVDKGPADNAGLKVGDVLLAINGHRIEHPDALGYRLATLSLEEEAEVDVFSRGKLVTVKVKLAAPPAEVAARTLIIEGRSPFAGAKISEPTSQIIRKLRIRGDVRGVVITDIERGSNAARSGFRPGDIIEDVNGEQMSSIDIAKDVLNVDRRSWRFQIIRNGRSIRQFLRY